jgi:hypothetical protein
MDATGGDTSVADGSNTPESGGHDSGSPSDAGDAGAVEAGAIEGGLDGSTGSDAGPDAGSGCISSIFGDYAVTAAGHVFATLGNSDSSKWVPVTVAGGGNLDHVVSGVASPNFGCAMRDSGTVWCWTNTPAASTLGKTSGEMGDGTTVWPAQPYVATQVQIQPSGAGPTYLTGIASLSDSGENAYGRPFCAVDTGGHVWCWGPTHPNGGGGTLLINTAGASYSAPYAVMVANSAKPGDLLTGVSQVSAGSNQICVILTTGQVKCWGSDAYGELGTATWDGGSANDSDYPLPVPGLPASPAPSQIWVGNGTNCVLIAGEVYCWGSAGFGETGTGVPPGQHCLGVFHWCEPAGNPVVTALSDGGVGGALTGVKDVYFGYSFGCAITTSGGLYCWGAGPSGIVLAEPFPLAAGGTPTNVTHVSSNTTGDFGRVNFSEANNVFYAGASSHSTITCQ